MKIVWVPLWRCNFRCIYCESYTQTNELVFQPLKTITDSFDLLINKLKNIDNKIDVVITGGEPSIYPNFFEIINFFISNVDNISICTNLSFDATKFVQAFEHNKNKNKIIIRPTFHPSCMKIEQFMSNLETLKLFIEEINVVADKYNLKGIDDIVHQMNNKKVKVNVLPFKFTTQKIKETENIKDKNYHSLETLNSKKELEKIEQIYKNQDKSLSKYETGEKSSFGKMCIAGYKYIKILPNGNIRRCAIDNTYLGNIFDKDYKFYTSAQKCTQKECKYEFHNIIED